MRIKPLESIVKTIIAATLVSACVTSTQIKCENGIIFNGIDNETRIIYEDGTRYFKRVQESCVAIIEQPKIYNETNY